RHARICNRPGGKVKSVSRFWFLVSRGVAKCAPIFQNEKRGTRNEKRLFDLYKARTRAIRPRSSLLAPIYLRALLLFATFRLFVTLKTFGTPLARMLARSLSPWLSTTPSRSTWPFFTTMWIGGTDWMAYLLKP